MVIVTDAPLVVDLDGTLATTDTLLEALLKAIRQSPLALIRLSLWLFRGRARFKAAVASRGGVACDRLPYCEPLLRYLRAQHLKGRTIVLATAAHRSIAENVASHLGLFDQVLATEAGINLKGERKLQAIRENVGDTFVYAGNSKADLPIWKAAQAAVLVNVSSATGRTVRRSVPIECEFRKNGAGPETWLRALRVHQWMKNLLLFVPLLTAFSFLDPVKLVAMGIAFLAFSLAASATYMINDLWDLESDRLHPRKCQRPFATGQISILQGLLVAAVLLMLSLGLADEVSAGFALMLLLYVGLTSVYSWMLKGKVLIDVLLLSVLYTVRILAGSVAIRVATSTWLLAFSVFIFLSLALVKRCAELVSLDQDGSSILHGRDYRVTDLVVLWPLGIGSALSAVVVFGLFISAPETRERYNAPQMLWLVALGLVYWLARLWIKTSRGEMHDDPLIYAMHDRGSRITVFVMFLVTLAAHFLTLDVSL